MMPLVRVTFPALERWSKARDLRRLRKLMGKTRGPALAYLTAAEEALNREFLASLTPPPPADEISDKHLTPADRAIAKAAQTLFYRAGRIFITPIFTDVRSWRRRPEPPPTQLGVP